MIKLVVIVGVILAGLIMADTASAQVGDVEICHAVTGSNTSSSSVSNNVETAQVFTTTNGFTMTGIKLPVYDNSISSEQPDDTFQIDIYNTTTPGSEPVPDYTGGAIASVNGDTGDLINATNTASDQSLNCSSQLNTAQVFEFNTPVSLSAGTSYAIVFQAGCSTACANIAVRLTSNDYAGGAALNNSAVGDEATPTDWAYMYGSSTDSGFAIYNNIITPPDTCDFGIDCWINSFLDEIGLNDSNGRMLFSVIITGGVLITLLMSGVKPIIALFVGGILGAGLAFGTLLDPTIFVAGLAVVSIAIFIALIVFGRNSGGDLN